jgi:hypothetical protein
MSGSPIFESSTAVKRFGWSVSLNAAGNIVAVGAPESSITFTDSGAVYIYKNISGSWTSYTTIVPGGTGDQSGRSVSLNAAGDRVAIGASNFSSNTGRVFIYELVGVTSIGTISPATPGESAGYSVSLNSSGDRVAIGAPDFNSTSGRVLIYQYVSGSSWSLIGTILNSASFGNFGNSVSLNDAGDMVAIGTPFIGRAQPGAGYIFKYIYPNWIRILITQGTGFGTFSAFGFSVSLNKFGDVLALGIPYYGVSDTGGFSIRGTPFYNIAIGDQTGNTFQNMYAVGIGYQSGVYSQGLAAVAIGYQAGQTQQGFNAVAIGYQAGQTRQQSGAIAIGYQAGQGTYFGLPTGQATNAIAIGSQAGEGMQGFNAVAIGSQAGQTRQYTGGVAIGFNAGTPFQRTQAIAIGCLSGQGLIGAVGQGDYSIALGFQTYEGYSSFGKTVFPHTNTIMLNASGSILTSGATGTFHVKPIRSAPIGSTYRNLLYDMSFNEIVYNGSQTCSNAKTFIIDHPDDQQNKYLVHACLEGPEAGVFYRGKGTIQNNRSAVITLPRYVRKLAYDFTVQLTPIRTSPTKSTKLTSSSVIDGKFTAYGANGSFFWLVYAKRQSIEAEMPKSTTKVYGDGPYKYHL